MALAALWGACAPSSAHAYSAAVESAKAATVAIVDSSAGIIGSGVVVAPDWVITAAHVVEAAEREGLEFSLRTQDGVVRPYVVDSRSSDLDLALLRVDGAVGPVAVGGASGSVGAGDEVFALGYPLGLDSISVTKGVVSAPLQVVDGATYLQTDASINPGNSGGPLVDSQGRLIGINVAKANVAGVDNMGFAVPLDVVRQFLAGTSVGELGSAAGMSASPITGGGGGSQGDGGALLLFGIGATALTCVAYLVYASRSANSAGADTPAFVAPSLSVAGSALEPKGSGATLKLLLDGPQGHSQAFVELPAVLGRSSDATLQVSDAQASRYHLRVVQGPRGVVVYDMSSRNGTFVDGRKCDEFELAVGGSFRIGETTVTRIG